MRRHTPVRFAENPLPSTLECPQCGSPNLIILDAKLYERSSDRLSVKITEIGCGSTFIFEQAAGGSDNPSPLGDAISIHLGCFFCTQEDSENAPTLALLENRGQVELAWVERDEAEVSNDGEEG